MDVKPPGRAAWANVDVTRAQRLPAVPNVLPTRLLLPLLLSVVLTNVVPPATFSGHNILGLVLFCIHRGEQQPTRGENMYSLTSPYAYAVHPFFAFLFSTPYYSRAPGGVILRTYPRFSYCNFLRADTTGRAALRTVDILRRPCDTPLRHFCLLRFLSLGRFGRCT